MSVLNSHIGVCSWSLQPSGIDDLILRLKLAGVNKVQLALEPLRRDPPAWAGLSAKLDQTGIHIVSGMFEPVGEDYTTLESIRKTGGVVSDQTWHTNWSNIQRCTILAKCLSVHDISLHAGFITEDTGGSAYLTLIDRIRRIADLVGDKLHGRLLLETGQESAEQLLSFLEAVDRTNVAINFDPANMILYSTGNPIEALGHLMPKVRQVHIKDACYSTVLGQWGKEVPVGQGAVDWRAFMRVLTEAGYNGYCVVERESGLTRLTDVIATVRFIRNLAVCRA